jgi:glycosyltransferase involved in cell wall biosynthesis
VKQYGLEGNVQFLGNVPQTRVREEFGRSQAFVFPSLREFGGGVVLEALGSGLPAIVVDYGGPGELATPECGVLLPMRPRAELVPLLQAAMEELAGDAARCRRLSQEACRRIREEFTWSTKAGRLVEMYRQILGAA